MFHSNLPTRYIPCVESNALVYILTPQCLPQEKMLHKKSLFNASFSNDGTVSKPTDDYPEKTTGIHASVLFLVNYFLWSNAYFFLFETFILLKKYVNMQLHS